MQAFRYAQFCPLARAAEVLGHRWNLLVLRELFVGPQRFTDLRRHLAGVSSSVLAARLRELESLGVVAQRQLPPPAACAVYELTRDGRAFGPALRELARWGLRFQVRDGYRAGDHVEPEWVRLGAECFASRGATPPRSIALRVRSGADGREAVFRVVGGPAGTRVEPGEGSCEATLSGAPLPVLAAMAGAFDPTAPGAPPDLAVEGDREAARALPTLFDMDFGDSDPEPASDAPAPDVPSPAPFPQKGTP